MEADTRYDGALRWIDAANDGWKSGRVQFAIELAATGEFVGLVGFAVDDWKRSAEAFYWLLPEARGAGVITRALRLCVDFAFAGGVERVYVLVHPENDASHRVAQRCGFTREGTLRAYEPFKGGRPDLVSWSLLPSDSPPSASD
jgi:RimJ/RimL family protein N-acetyltransferase